MKQFIVDNEVFFYDENLNGQFAVDSVPRRYTVSFSKVHPGDEIKSLSLEEDNFFLIDERVRQLYFSDINFHHERLFCITATEENKTIETALQVVSWLAANGFTKKEHLHVIGGGITQDIGAFVGASYKRGISWSLYPTTLLSMCDSCIGGKTGINYQGAKNQLALFSAPRHVQVHTDFLQTLTQQDILSGLGETVKLLLTGGREALAGFAAFLDKATGSSRPEASMFEPWIIRALSVKKAVIEKDEFEISARRSLNFGHTIGHALELASNYAICHGLAVALGVLCANRYAQNTGMLSQDDVTYMRDLLAPLVRQVSLEKLEPEIFYNALLKDKKTLGNMVTLILLKEPGVTCFEPTPVSRELAKSLLDITRNEWELCQ